MNIFKIFSRKEFICECIELHNEYKCILPIKLPSEDFISSAIQFYEENNFTIVYNIIDPEWEEKIQLEEIYKKLILIYNFDPKDDNIVIVYKNHKKVFLPNNFYINIPPGAVFVYDKSKLKVSY